MSSTAREAIAGQWIKVANTIDGYVFHVNGDGSLEVGVSTKPR